jgi:hypothetical protein
MRYETGFSWVGGGPGYDKFLYIDTGGSADVIPEFAGAGITAYAQGPGISDNYQINTGTWGWDDIMDGAASDGEWHCYEFYMKMDTNQRNGVGRIWVDGILRAENIAVNFSGGEAASQAGWTGTLIGSNQSTPDNGRDMAVDFDDMVIYSTTPPNVDAAGNPFIGPIR